MIARTAGTPIAFHLIRSSRIADHHWRCKTFEATNVSLPLRGGLLNLRPTVTLHYPNHRSCRTFARPCNGLRFTTYPTNSRQIASQPAKYLGNRHGLCQRAIYATVSRATQKRPRTVLQDYRLHRPLFVAFKSALKKRLTLAPKRGFCGVRG